MKGKLDNKFFIGFYLVIILFVAIFVVVKINVDTKSDSKNNVKPIVGNNQNISKKQHDKQEVQLKQNYVSNNDNDTVQEYLSQYNLKANTIYIDMSTPVPLMDELNDNKDIYGYLILNNRLYHNFGSIIVNNNDGSAYLSYEIDFEKIKEHSFIQHELQKNLLLYKHKKDDDKEVYQPFYYAVKDALETELLRARLSNKELTQDDILLIPLENILKITEFKLFSSASSPNSASSSSSAIE